MTPSPDPVGVVALLAVPYKEAPFEYVPGATYAIEGALKPGEEEESDGS